MEITGIRKNQYGRFNYTAKVTLHHWTHTVKGSYDFADHRFYIKSVDLALDHAPHQFIEVVELVEQSKQEIIDAINKKLAAR